MNNTIAITEELIQLLEECGIEDALAVARLLYVRLRQPHAYITVTGETSTGKSSLINGLFKKNLLPVAASPTTATVTHVVCKDDIEDNFFAIYRDATQEKINVQQFAALTLSPSADLLRLQVRSNPIEKKFIGFQLFDTPGYNAMISEHEEVSREFLPQSDMIVFVAGYRSGFGQIDQDLFEVIRSAIGDRDEIPILLVINRTPQGISCDNSRVKEIYDNAKDSLKREPQLILIESQTDDTSAIQSRSPVIPRSMPVWEAVVAEVSKPANIEFVNSRLLQLLKDLLDEVEERFVRREIELTASEEDILAIKNQIEILISAKNQSFAAVDRLADRLSTQLPKTIERFIPTLKAQMNNEISASDKWLGAQECAEWIAVHALPFAVRESTRSIEDQIHLELQELNRELEDIANTAIKKITHEVEVKSDATRRFAESIAKTFLKRISGSGINNLLLSYGGVGGAAAGAGNLVKMALSRIGNVFGKTFNREVYNQIGRTFTKTALKRLTVVLTVIIEVVGYLYHVKTWRNKLIEKVKEGIDEWALEVKKDILQETIPKLIHSNKESVTNIYDDLIKTDSGSDMSSEVDLKDVARRIKVISELKRRLNYN